MKFSIKDVPTEQVLRYQHEWSTSNRLGKKLPYTYERFPEFDEKLVYKKMEKLSDQGYIDYGVSLRTGWLTEKGLELIAHSARKDS